MPISISYSVSARDMAKYFMLSFASEKYQSSPSQKQMAIL